MRFANSGHAPSAMERSYTTGQLHRTFMSWSLQNQSGIDLIYVWTWSNCRCSRRLTMAGHTKSDSITEASHPNRDSSSELDATQTTKHSALSGVSKRASCTTLAMPDSARQGNSFIPSHSTFSTCKVIKSPTSPLTQLNKSYLTTTPQAKRKHVSAR